MSQIVIINPNYMKRKVLFTIVVIFITSNCFAQDGSDIKYYEPNKLDSTLVGVYCYVDFGEVSFGGQVIDTIEFNVKGQLMKFYEHRVDNGFDNWFNDQYLIRVEDNTQILTRLQNSKIDSLVSDRIYVTSILSYYANESPIDTITVFQHWYDLKKISKVLIRD